MPDEVARVTVRVRRSIHRDLAEELLATGRYLRAKRLIQLAGLGLLFERTGGSVRALVALEPTASGVTHVRVQTSAHGIGEISVSDPDPVDAATAGLMTAEELAALFLKAPGGE